MKIIAAALLCAVAAAPCAWGQEITPTERRYAWEHVKATSIASIALMQASLTCHVLDVPTANGAIAGLIADARTDWLSYGPPGPQLEGILHEGQRQGLANATPEGCAYLRADPAMTLHIKRTALLLGRSR